MKFNHLNVPTHWQNYWTRYPEGYTILEALLSWVKQVDDMVDSHNSLNANIEQFRNEIDDFVGRFDERLQDEVTQTLKDWQTSGFLDVVISSAMQWELDSLKNKIEYQQKQTELISNFYKKLTTSQPTKIVSQGDSITYGQDTTSTDKRAADTTPTDNGTAHSFTRASTTYPEELERNLQSIYGSQITVINKGYSGDWAEASYEHWNNNDLADLATIMLGTNDSSYGSSWVPETVRGNLSKYIEDIRKLVERYLDWGTAVVLITPPRLKKQELINTSTDRITEAYRNALIQLGLEYNVPVIDSEGFMNGWDVTYYSDEVHLNAKGYKAFAGRLTSIFVGFIHSIPKIGSGNSIGTRVTRDNFIKSSGVVLTEFVSSPGAEENLENNGLVANIPINEKITYSFDATEDDLILLPVYYVNTGSKIEVSLDFGNEQGSINLTRSVNKITNQGVKPNSVISNTISSNEKDTFNGTIDEYSTSRYLHITQRGLHTVTVSNIGETAAVLAFNGFVVMSYKDFADQAQKTEYKINTHPSLSDTQDVPTTVLDVNKLSNKIGLNIDDNYWKNKPLKITVFNYNQNIIEYTVAVGGYGITAGWILGIESRETKLTASPLSSNVRTLTSISYNRSTKELSLNWGGATTRPTTILVSAL